VVEAVFTVPNYSSMNKTSSSVDGFLRKNKTWREELTELRKILLDCGLAEEIKWRVPCYTFQNNNVAIINGFKEYCVLSFFKGALFKDSKAVLETPGPNTQSARVIRFTNVQEIVHMKPVLKDLIRQAIAVEKAGLKVKFKKITEFAIPEELQAKFDHRPALKKAFEALTPGRQRAYLMHFSAPKQSKTRVSRIEKCVSQILEGKGLNDEYKR
jgi:uncharacterized protein YdeI (YjbR/CyaY-like superfamily)